MRAPERNGKRAKRADRRAGRGLVSILLATALLGILGFGLGVVAGLVLEEPGLLLDYVTGRTTTAELEVPTPASEPFAVDAPAGAAPEAPAVAALTSPPSVSAAPPASPQALGRPSPAVEVAADPIEASPAPVAAPPQSAPAPSQTRAAPAHAEQTGYAVQVGALGDAASAEQLAAKLAQRGYRVYVTPSAEPGVRRWRVRVGPVPTREEAQRLAAQLEREKLPTWVLAEGRR